MFRFLGKEHTVAQPNYNRWLVPPAALAIHLSIGMAYGFSVFWLPLSHAIGIDKSAPGDWTISALGWIYTLFFVFLGSSAAVFGGWLERHGPRKAGVVAAFCWGGGFFISALGVYYHNLALLLIGSGVIGGCGLGLGYISPVSTLIKWFPDKRGMATGMAIMGFGGGAVIGAPLADRLMKHFATPTSVGVWQTFITLGIVYFIAMMCGAFAYRVPAAGWKPCGWNPPDNTDNGMITDGHVHVSNAHKTSQFWLLWGVLCLNVSASIGIIGIASPMLQEIFGGRLLGINKAFASLTESDLLRTATIGAAFAGLLSLFNIGGRIFWASLSDHLGRKRTYTIFFALGILLYLGASFIGQSGSIALFVAMFCVIVSLYGGGFATIPAYLADLFGSQYVGAIHGRLLTAWSAAGILGPVIVNYAREYMVKRNVPMTVAYTKIFYIMAGLLVAGLICNLLVRPVKDRHFMDEKELEKTREHERKSTAAPTVDPNELFACQPSKKSWPMVIAAWTAVGIPLAWGLFKTLEKVLSYFN